MKEVKQFSKSYIFISALYVVLGIVLLAWPTLSVQMICYGFTVAMIVIGFSYGIMYFTKDNLEKPCKEWLKAEGKECNASKHSAKGHYEKVKIVRFSLKPNREKMAMRMCLSEHPFGTIKRAMGATYFLLRGLRKVTGEFALLCLGYNIERAKNLLGFEKMMEIIAGV